MNIGIVGCGSVGIKRSKSLGKNVLKAVADIEIEKAYLLASKNTGVKAFSDYKELCKLSEIDIVIVSTTNNMLVSITLEAIRNGKHVLVEKPGAISSTDILILIEEQKKHNVKVKVGYNLRDHPALLKAKEIVDSTDIGNLMYVNGTYGHGGRLNYEKEWRANTIISGGGILIDLGVHLIDLSRWFLNDEFSKINGSIHTYFWNMQVEDNAFLHLETKDHKVAFLHASCTEWKNTFSFKITGERGKLQIDGLEKSYGTERLTYYRLRPQLGPPITTIWEYPFPDNSWEVELREFVNSIRNDIEPECNLNDALETMKIVEQIYKINTTRGKYDNI